MKYERIYLKENNEQVYLDIYVADPIPGHNFIRDAILVIPGGGYGCVCNDREGEPIAQAFMPYGFNAFVLHYSVGCPGDPGHDFTFPTQLIEASLAIKHIKDHAEEYGIDPNRVFVTGSSAGGHLSASLGVLWNIKEIYDAIDMPYGYNKPAGMILCYPVISADKEIGHMGSFINLWNTNDFTDEQAFETSIEKHVNKDTACPLFMVHTSNDEMVNVRNSLVLANAYAREGIKFEMHVYLDGPHGMSLANAITDCGNPAWNEPCYSEWVKQAAMWTKRV